MHAGRASDPAGAAGHLAQMLAGALSGRFERERPGLAGGQQIW